MNIIKNKKYSIFMNASKYSFLLLFLLTIPLFFATAFIETPPTKTETPPTGVNVSVRIENPLSDSISDIPSLVNALFQIVLTIGVPIIALAIIYSGFLFVKAQGSPEEITKAKKTLMYTLIGAALLLGSWVIASALKGTVDEISS